VGNLWWDTNGGNLYLWYDDGTSQQWVPATNQPGAASVFTGAIPPSSPQPNALWWDSVGGQLYVWYNDGTSTQWVVANNTQAGVASFNSRQGAVTLTTTDITNANGFTTAGGALYGNVSINQSTGSAILSLTAPNQQSRMVMGAAANGNARWAIYLGDGTQETGGNNGADFDIQGFTDAGAYLNTPFKIKRSTGDVNIAGGSVLADGRANWSGVQCRQGSAGAVSGNYHNIDWVSGAHLWVDTSNVGAFAFTSDYRTKQNVEPLPSTWQHVKALRPISYQHNDYKKLYVDDGVERWGFLAHELQETLIESAATGVKDQENVIQSPDPWTIIATLTKALQEAMARIEALEERVR
jgi:hypothetical protein